MPTPHDIKTAVIAVLDAIPDPESGDQGLHASGRVSGLVVRPDGKVGFAIETARGQADEPLRVMASEAVASVPGVTGVTAVLTSDLPAGAPPQPKSGHKPAAAPSAPSGRAPAAGPARLLIAVASAKGGVGKSTTAANLAVAAARMGLRVGLLDADVFGPSVPTMMGTVERKPELTDDKRLRPVRAHGVETMSLGYLVDPAKAVAWRGPMVVSAITQMIQDTSWGDLDVLFIDTPPGTGEVQLTLVQRLPLSGAVIVSTPQEVALADVRRGVEMFRKTAVPILGVIENMAWFETPDGARHHIFGEGGAQRTATEMGVPFLGALPILPQLREGGDEGVPAATGAEPATQAFRLLADAILSAASAGASKPAPKIVFE